jgi:hypothetical protein
MILIASSKGDVMSQQTLPRKSFQLSEDWWSVIVAFVLILLAVIGLIGPNGLHITF